MAKKKAKAKRPKIEHVRLKGAPIRMTRELAEKLNEVIDRVNKKG